MNAVDLASIIIAGCTAAGAILTMMAWVYRRGHVESSLQSSMQANTESTRELTNTVSTLNNSLSVGFREVHDRIDGHEVRIALSERDIDYLNRRVQVAAHILKPNDG